MMSGVSSTENCSVCADMLSLTLHAKGFKGGRSKNVHEANVGGNISRSGRSTFVHALHEVSFSLNEGDALAVVGRNGSGKSTLMRVLAGIYPHSAGELFVRGKVTTLFTNQIGVNYNATGLENIKLMSMLMGLGEDDLDELIEDVRNFSELGDYLDMPVRIYSAGMRARLGFGIATAVKPDVLLIDEVFGTGDQYFKVKAKQRMQRFLKNSGTTMMASHSIQLLDEYCNKALWIDRGRVRMFGDYSEVRKEYVHSSM